MPPRQRPPTQLVSANAHGPSRGKRNVNEKNQKKIPAQGEGITILVSSQQQAQRGKERKKERKERKKERGGEWFSVSLESSHGGRELERVLCACSGECVVPPLKRGITSVPQPSGGKREMNKRDEPSAQEREDALDSSSITDKKHR